MMLRHSMLLIALSLWLTACAEFMPSQRVEASFAMTEFSQESGEVVALLAYYQRLLSLSQEEQRKEHQDATQVLARDKTDSSRLRLALTLCVPNAPWRDDARLQQLLEAVQTGVVTSDSPRRNLATLMVKAISDRGRELRRVELLHKDEQKRAQDLQQKLDAMLNIERNLRQRSDKTGTK